MSLFVPGVGAKPYMNITAITDMVSTADWATKPVIPQNDDLFDGGLEPYDIVEL